MKTASINHILMGGLLLGLASCSQDNPFETQKGEGYLSRDAMNVEFKNAEHLVRSANVELGDFQVEIRKKETAGTKGELVRSYAYSEMPEVVALPVGDYTVEAIYGDNPTNAFDAPYYLGNTDLRIEAGKIADDIEPVVCKLSNIRVTISFGQELSESMSPDSKVTVRVGQTGTLDFTKEHEGRSGYFAYTPGSQTITATFSGTIDGVAVNETKTYDNAATGNHYKVNFNLHQPGAEDPGTIGSTITVDATVTEIPMVKDIDPEDVYLTDDMRPVEEGEEPGPGPGPDDPQPTKPAPTVTAQAPIDLTKVNQVTDGMPVVLYVTSEAEGGITGFLVTIDSTTLTPDELEAVDLTDKLDLVNPGQFETAITNLQLPCNVGGMKEVTFDISGFMPLLGLLGSGDHNFILDVTDANGSTRAVLRLKN